MKAAYLPHPMAYPFKYVISQDIIGTDEAKKCQAACEYSAIDLEMKPETITYNVGAVVWATGWDPYDATKIDYLGFGKIPNVVTSVMFERMASFSGPTQGKLVRPSDGKEVKSVAFVQCSGSRDENHLAYCSGICCLASLKQATYVRERVPDSSAYHLLHRRSRYGQIRGFLYKGRPGRQHNPHKEQRLLGFPLIRKQAGF